MCISYTIITAKSLEAVPEIGGYQFWPREGLLAVTFVLKGSLRLKVQVGGFIFPLDVMLKGKPYLRYYLNICGHSLSPVMNSI